MSIFSFRSISSCGNMNRIRISFMTFFLLSSGTCQAREISCSWNIKAHSCKTITVNYIGYNHTLTGTHSVRGLSRDRDCNCCWRGYIRLSINSEYQRPVAPVYNGLYQILLAPPDLVRHFAFTLKEDRDDLEAHFFVFHIDFAGSTEQTRRQVDVPKNNCLDVLLLANFG